MAKAKLHQIIALVQGKKGRAQTLLTEAHRGWKPEAISGISKVYEPKEDDGERLPPESKRVQLSVTDRLRETLDQLVRFIDITATQDHANTHATANVEVGGEVLLKNQPPTVLLFLEKQLTDVHTFVSGLPVLPLDRDWQFDNVRDCHVTKPIESIRTKKRAKVIVKYDATEKHPAQTELFTEDVPVGTWKTTYMSSAIPAGTRQTILRRVEALQDAVKSAREQANSAEVEDQNIARRLMDHLFGDLIKWERAKK